VTIKNDFLLSQMSKGAGQLMIILF